MKPWMKIDADVLLDGKVWKAGRTAALVFIFGILAADKRNNSGGLVPDEDLDPHLLRAHMALLDLSVDEILAGIASCADVGLIEAVDGGYRIVSWEKFYGPVRELSQHPDAVRKRQRRAADRSAPMSGHVPDNVRTGPGTRPRRCPDMSADVQHRERVEREKNSHSSSTGTDNRDGPNGKPEQDSPDGPPGVVALRRIGFGEPGRELELVRKMSSGDPPSDEDLVRLVQAVLDRDDSPKRNDPGLLTRWLQWGLWRRVLEDLDLEHRAQVARRRSARDPDLEGRREPVAIDGLLDELLQGVG